MDIMMGDKLKKELKLMSWYLRRKLKKDYKITVDEIHNDMQNCGNPVIAEIYNLIMDASEEIKENYQKNISTEFSEMLLWIIYRDTAYSPIFMYILKNLMDKKDELMPRIEKYYVEPKDWYVNRWNDAKKHTRELRTDGKIPDFDAALSQDELVFVPKIQKQIAQKLGDMDKEIEEEKKKRVHSLT